MLSVLFPTLAALSLLLMASPRASAQVPTPQTGGSGENAPPPAKTAADKETKKEDGTPTLPTKKSKKHHAAAAAIPDPDASAEPDKILYDRAERDLKGGRYTEGRLALQTLINTYPDSEYLAKAKLAVADSYYKEGGTANLTQSIQEYNDFQTFFPFLDEAAYAQMQIGMAHYHMMEKADRDKTQAEAAEDAFQAFLLKYPQSPLAPKAEQDLRDVQEVLADGDYKVAYFYYRKFDYRASAARLVELTDRYPLYSQNDDALWMLGDIYQRAKQASKNEDDKNHWGDLSAKCYAKIVRDYPLSKMAPAAKERLTAMGKPVPSADPDAVVRMQKQQMYERQHHQSIVLKLPLGMLKGSPDVSDAAHNGTPQMNPPNDVVSATDILRPGAQGPSFTVTGGAASNGSGANSSGSSDAVTPVDATTVPVGSGDAQTGVGVQIITPGEESPAPKTDAAPAAAAPPADPNTPVATPQPATGGDTPAAAPAAPPATDGTPAAAPGANPADSSSSSSAGNGANAAAGSSTTSSGSTQKSEQAAQAAPNDSSQESTSKKKKGLKKLIPW